MPRKGPAPKSPVVADPVYNSPVVTALINKILLHGKRSTAEGIVYTALEGTRAKTEVDPVITLKRALDNIKPAVEVKSRRIGGATYQIPVEVRPARRQSLALRWLRDYASERSGKTMVQKLADEIIDASQNRGGSVKKREDVYKMAEANKAFAHLKW